MKKIKHILILAVLGVIAVSCKNENVKEDCTNDLFDRTVLLENWADNIIIPSYVLYNEEVADLQQKVVAFTEIPNQSNLDEARSAWLEAYTVWQNVSIYEIGQAELINMRDFTNSYPLDEILVESNISSGNYNLSLSTNLFAQGFPAMDYLLNGLSSADNPISDTEVIAKYVSDDNAVNYKTYLNNVSSRLAVMGSEIVSNWKGSYRDVFVANNCSSSTASLDKLTNDMIFNLEKITRVSKIGVPIDFFGSGANMAPEAVEAVYKKDVSKKLLLASLVASQNLFNGKYLNSETEGESLKSYLDELQIEAGGKMLSTVINETYDKAIEQAESLDANFYVGIGQDRDKYKVTRDRIHNVIEVLKTNMISALGIKADYNDSDGD